MRPARPVANLALVAFPALAALLLAARAGTSPRRLAGGAAILAGVVALGVALAAVQVWPARELIARTPRGEAADWSFLTFGSFGPWGLPTLLAPDLFGTPVDGTFWGGPDWSHFAETCTFVGAVVVALAMAALFLRRDLVTAAFGGLGALSFVLMLGRFTPVYHVLAWIPIVRSTRLPARFSLLLTLSLAILAALGLDALQREPDRKRRGIAVAVGAGAVFALTIGGFLALAPVLSPDAAIATTGRAWSAHFAAIAAATRSTAMRLAVVTAATLLSLMPFVRRRVPSWAGLAPLMVLTLDLLSWGRAFNPAVPAAVLRTPPPAVAALPAVQPRPRIFRQGLDEMWERAPGSPRTDFVTPGWRGHEASYASATWALPPNSQLLWGVDSGEGFTSLPPAEWLEWMGLPSHPGAAPHPDLTEAQADLLSLDAVLSSGSGIDGPHWQSTALPGDLYLSRNLAPLPRVRFARSWTVLPRAQVLAEVRAAEYDPRVRVSLEAAPPGWPATHDGGPVDEPLRAQEIEPGHWEVDLPGDADGLVVLSESWDPDWKAFDGNGVALTVLRAEGLFLAVPVTRGVTGIALRYIPGAVQRGSIVSIAASLFCVTASFFFRRRRIAGLPSESRELPRSLGATFMAGAALLVGVCTIVGVGGGKTERARGSLPAAAARSWAGEAFAAFQAGAPAEAAKLLQSAMQADPGEAAYAYRLGLAQRRAGRTEEARSAFRRALEIDAGFAPAIEALREEDASTE